MAKCYVITRRLNNRVLPNEVLSAVYDLLAERDIPHTRCLWSLSDIIVEFEHNGKWYSNRENDPILKIQKDFPILSSCFEYSREDLGEGHSTEAYHLHNYKEINDGPFISISEETVREIIGKIPRPYKIDETECILDGVQFLGEETRADALRRHPSEWGPYVGSYICYSRYFYGNEKHQYIELAVEVDDGTDITPFREFYFALAERLPGTYKGTETINI